MPERQVPPISLSQLKDQALKVKEDAPMRISCSHHRGAPVHIYYEKDTSHISIVCSACEIPFLQMYLGEKPQEQSNPYFTVFAPDKPIDDVPENHQVGCICPKCYSPKIKFTQSQEVDPG